MIDRISSSPPPSGSRLPSKVSIPGSTDPSETFQGGSTDDLQALPKTMRGGKPGESAWGQSLTGDIRYHQVDSKILGNSRGVWVYLPPGYHENPDKKYPVLYMCDGQNVFEKGSSFGGVEWQADEAAQKLMTRGQMQDAILVAVSNAGAARMDEYTPVPDPDHGGGKADQYGKFLVDELKPMIDTCYQTETKAASTGIMGSSLGGLLSLHLAFNNPGTFGVCGALSPSLWWAGRDMLKEISKLPPGQGPERVWLDMGTQESKEDANHNGVDDVLDDVRDMRDLLHDRGFAVNDLGRGTAGDSTASKQLLYWEVPDATHSEKSWSERVDTVLANVYPSG